MDMMEIRHRIISSDTYRMKRLSIDDVENGSWAYSRKASSSKRLRSKSLYAVKAGDKVIYTTPSWKFYVGLLDTKTGTSYKQHVGWRSAGQVEQEFVIDDDGYITVIFETPDGSAADLADYDCTIDILRLN